MSSSSRGSIAFATPFLLVAAVAQLLAAPRAGLAQDAEEQVAAAVMPAPEPLRPTATVLGYADGKLTTLREGEGPLVCLADDPGEAGFHVACYHESLEPYMARGRELRARGMDDREAIAKRWEEIEAGSLAFPDRAVLYSLSRPAPAEEGAPAEGAEPSGDLQALTVVYLKGATAEAVGVPENPRDGIPWMMFSGRPTAHLMIHEPMPPR